MVYLKDPDAVLDYTVDWSGALVEGESLTSAEWLVSPQTENGLALITQSADGQSRTAMVSGGRPGEVYRLTNRVTTDHGRSYDRSFVIRIDQK